MKRSPIAVGSVLAVLAALIFGVTMPIVERAGRGLGPFTTAALLYVGASASAFLLGRVSRPSGAPVRRAHLARLLLVAAFGAGVAPTLLAWGLQRAGATSGSLLLNLEAVFTVLLAWSFYREPIGRQVLLALGLMLAGGIILTVGVTSRATWSVLGTLAIVGATAAWALDNTLTRGLTHQDPVTIVAIKGALGALITSTAAFALREPMPDLGAALALLGCGATGYGLSLRLYLLAQRRVGSARTGSIFAVAPFVGAGLAWALGDRDLGPWAGLSALLFATGVVLHVTERHAHRHVHLAVAHDHPHRHDDGHHDHVHDPPVAGEHSHPHRHAPLEHDHEHAPDLHHDHSHP